MTRWSNWKLLAKKQIYTLYIISIIYLLYIFQFLIYVIYFILLKCFCWQMKKWATFFPSLSLYIFFASYVFLLLRYFADRWKKNSHSFSFTIYYIFHIFLTSYIFLLLKCFCWQMKKWATLLPSPPLAIVSDNLLTRRISLCSRPWKFKKKKVAKFPKNFWNNQLPPMIYNLQILSFLDFEN